MISLHDKVNLMNDQICRLTDRGQVSMPAALRRQMRLKTGQRLRWEMFSDTEMRVFVEPEQPDPLAALGFKRKIHPERPTRRTSDWMQELRSGE
jgi:bifunctional DNA-binding transcriptional regulator/antitoxin component of YhaV-PrlF toxin-antitoxin module